MIKFLCAKPAGMVFLLCAASIASHAQTLTTLVNFEGSNGARPYLMSLVQGADGNFYGTTQAGGTDNYGTIFKVTPNGALTTLHSFRSTEGTSPSAGLVLSTNGNVYGTTTFGGTDNDGTIFTLSPAGKLAYLHSFQGSDGTFPYAALIQGADGDFYGTTLGGGTHEGGTIFKINPAGALTTFHNFCAQAGCADGALPYAGLMEGTDGNFYGTTAFGGAPYYNGTVFQITPERTYTVLYSFLETIFLGVPAGAQPYARLIAGPDGDFYGTTETGGANGVTVTVSDGTIFSITSGGSLTYLLSFDGTDGADPFAGLILATDGNFYGTTVLGGASGLGSVFRLTPAGEVTTLYSFAGKDGTEPYGGLVEGTDGNLYGTTFAGGANGYGTVFSLSVGLDRFVKTLPTSGTVGQTVWILGTDLTGATSVTVNGTAAAFTVVSPTLVTATVPAGATGGVVHVVTPSGTLSSNVSFRVLP